MPAQITPWPPRSENNRISTRQSATHDHTSNQQADPRGLEDIKGMVLTGAGHAAVMSVLGITDNLVTQYVFSWGTRSPPTTVIIVISRLACADDNIHHAFQLECATAVTAQKPQTVSKRADSAVPETAE